MKNTVRAVFCENVLIVCNEQKLMCYPMTYTKVVIPKYKITGCDFRQGGAPKTIYAGIILMLVGFACIVPAVTLNGSTQVCTWYGWREGYSCRYVDRTSPGAIIFIVLCVLNVLFGLFLLLIACCFKTHSVDLTMRKPSGSKTAGYATYLCRALQARLTGPEVSSLMMLQEPDKRFIKDYVFGCLSKNMGGYHALNHLIKDALVAPVWPKTAKGAIESTGMKAYVPMAQGIIMGESDTIRPESYA